MTPPSRPRSSPRGATWPRRSTSSEACAALVERDRASDAVVRIGLEVEGHLDSADAQITRIVGRLEELGAAGARSAG